VISQSIIDLRCNDRSTTDLNVLMPRLARSGCP